MADSGIMSHEEIGRCKHASQQFQTQVPQYADPSLYQASNVAYRHMIGRPLQQGKLKSVLSQVVDHLGKDLRLDTLKRASASWMEKNNLPIRSDVRLAKPCATEFP